MFNTFKGYLMYKMCYETPIVKTYIYGLGLFIYRLTERDDNEKTKNRLGNTATSFFFLWTST